MNHPPFTAWEFFAGGGMARLGLQPAFRATFANDFDPVKAAAYRANFGGEHLSTADIHALTPADLPGRADLAWASSPCQDFSLAGARAGLGGGRSSALIGFLRLIGKLGGEGRAPPVLVIENVPGLLSARGGADFAALRAALDELGYRSTPFLLDAAAFLPQSRPRVFVVASRGDPIPEPPSPPGRSVRLEAILDPAAPWSQPADTARLLQLLNPLHRARLTARPCTALAYRRVRVEGGLRTQRLELRTDGLAGCLRTPAGGSSRQFVLDWDGARARSRLLTPREGARLMGLPDSYLLPAGATAAWRVVGDGVAVPAVAWLARFVLAPVAGRSLHRAA
ncbi:MAG: DNA cytosine methyltransferase [Proteobacteria bacterium]|nr:DNA cytosine methyltransferase [Pseudomonadota bacterium]